MKNVAFILLTILTASLKLVYGVAPSWEWKCKFNANIQCIKYHESFIYTVGVFADSVFKFGNVNIPNHGKSDILIMKWDTTGNLIWANNIYGSEEDSCVSLDVNANNELIVTGNTKSPVLYISVDTFATHGGQDFIVAKYDLNGSFLKAVLFGTAGYDYINGMCFDHQSNIYISSNFGILKYDPPLQNLIWQRYMYVNNILFSKFDTTLVAIGSFTNTYVFGNFSITAAYSPQYGVTPDIFAAKLSLDNIPVWLQNVTNFHRSDYGEIAYVSEKTGYIAVASSHYTLSGENAWLYSISPNGQALLGVLIVSDGLAGRNKSICINDSIISVATQKADQVNNYFYDIFTLQQLGSYSNLGGYFDHSFQSFLGMHALYTMSENNISLGKVNNTFLSINPSFHTLKKCIGLSTSISGVILGGVGPKTYSWFPATGLNNVNTDTVTFSPQNNISYILTVTDSIGQIAHDTFSIIVDTPLVAQHITSQYPTFCKDSMKLYSNMGTPVQWKKFTPPNLWTWMGAEDIDKYIHTIGKYSYIKFNTCGPVADTTEVLPVVNVAALASDTSLCLGQSVTLSGSGALNYSWTGGITDQVAFTPVATHTYTVTGIDANGCKNTSAISVVVNPLPTISNLTATPPFICTQGIAMLRLDTVSGDVVTWLPNTFLNTDTGNYVTVNNINTSTNYTVTITDVNGCSRKDSIYLPVNQTSFTSIDTTICSTELPLFWNGQSLVTGGTYFYQAINAYGCDSVCTLNLTVNPVSIAQISPGSDTSICAGTSLILTTDTGFASFSWQNNAQIISKTNTAIVNSGGAYVLTCIDTNGCSSSDVVNVNILPLPAPFLSYETYYLTCHNVLDETIQWFRDGLLINDTNNAIYIANEGMYKVVVKDSNGCESADSLQIDINLLTNSPNDVSLFPNPSSGDITINYVLTDPSDVSILLFDVNGRAIHTFLKDNSQQKGFHRQVLNLDKMGIEKGIYFFRIQLGLDTYNKKMLYHR